jgi:hypothetical protein
VDKFIQIVRENNLRPEEINKVTAHLSPTSPWSDTLETSEDIFLNLPYQMACAAHGIPPSRWHDPDIMKSPEIRGFIPKIGRTAASHTSDDEGTGAEVFVKGKSFKETGDCKDGVCIIRRISEKELIKKFEENCSGMLLPDKRDKLVEAVLNLDKLEDVTMIMQLATS